MRSFTPKTLRTATLTALLITAPFTGAYAASAVSGPRVTALIDQGDSLDRSSTRRG
jgi:hypothetical protein